MRFNNLFAVIVTGAVFAFAFLGAALAWDNKIADVALGIFLAKFSDIVQFYFRKAKGEKK